METSPFLPGSVAETAVGGTAADTAPVSDTAATSDTATNDTPAADNDTDHPTSDKPLVGDKALNDTSPADDTAPLKKVGDGMPEWSFSFINVYSITVPANKEPFLNQLVRVILVHNWYHSTSTCFLVHSHEYTCSACCHEF